MENPIINMATRPEKSKKGEISQEELRQVFREKFDSLSKITKSSLDDYDKLLSQGEFDSEDGEKKRLAIQDSLTKKVERLEKMKAVLDSGEDLPQVMPTLSATHTYKNEKGKDVSETITLSLEDTLTKFTSLYKKTGIDLPPDFEAQVEQIWQNNYDTIVDEVEKEGFNNLVIAPGNIPLTELSEKMKMGKGYFTGSNFDGGGGFAGAKSQDIDKPRLILVHKVQNLKEDPRLKRTLNVKAKDTDTTNSLSLEDYIIFQRQYFEETGKHLDENGSTWIPKTKSGTRFVYSYWRPGDGGLGVYAGVPGHSNSFLGCRPSRYFF